MPTWITVIVVWMGALVLGVAVMWLTGPMRARRKRTDPEDYDRRSAYPAARADDELAAQRREELDQAWREWGR